MFETLVIATDGSDSVTRAVECGLDLAARFEAAVHALYIIDESQIHSLPSTLHGDVRQALTDVGETALDDVVAANDAREAPVDLTTAVRVGRPERQIVGYVRDTEADGVAMGTRGRSGSHSFLLGSVAERVVRTCPVPVLTVRQLDAGTDTS